MLDIELTNYLNSLRTKCARFAGIRSNNSAWKVQTTVSYSLCGNSNQCTLNNPSCLSAQRPTWNWKSGATPSSDRTSNQVWTGIKYCHAQQPRRLKHGISKNSLIPQPSIFLTRDTTKHIKQLLKLESTAFTQSDTKGSCNLLNNLIMSPRTYFQLSMDLKEQNAHNISKLLVCSLCHTIPSTQDNPVERQFEIAGNIFWYW